MLRDRFLKGGDRLFGVAALHVRQAQPIDSIEPRWIECDGVLERRDRLVDIATLA